MSKKRTRRKRRTFSDEYKAEVVELCRTSSKSVGEISRELDLTETAVRDWLKKADAEQSVTEVKMDRDLEAELRTAKKRIKELEMEREILKKAAEQSIGQRNSSSGKLDRPKWRRRRPGEISRMTSATRSGDDGEKGSASATSPELCNGDPGPSILTCLATVGSHRESGLETSERCPRRSERKSRGVSLWGILRVVLPANSGELRRR